MSQATQNRPKESGSSMQGSRQSAMSHGGEEVDFQQMCDSVCSSVKSYSSQNPAVLASVVFLAGFYLGWKVKPW